MYGISYLNKIIQYNDGLINMICILTSIMLSI